MLDGVPGVVRRFQTVSPLGTTRQGEVSVAMHALGTAIECLEAQCSHLIQSIGRVSAHVDSVEVFHAADEEFSTPLAHEIQIFRQRLNALGVQVEEATRKVEL